MNGAPGTCLLSVARGGTRDEARGTLLHEAMHGLFYVHPPFADTCTRFWRNELDDAARATWRTFLAGLGYDAAHEELCINEFQARAHLSQPVHCFVAYDVQRWRRHTCARSGSCSVAAAAAAAEASSGETLAAAAQTPQRLLRRSARLLPSLGRTCRRHRRGWLAARVCLRTPRHAALAAARFACAADGRDDTLCMLCARL